MQYSIMVKSTVLKILLIWLESQLCHLLAMWPWKAFRAKFSQLLNGDNAFISLGCDEA